MFQNFLNVARLSGIIWNSREKLLRNTLQLQKAEKIAFDFFKLSLFSKMINYTLIGYHIVIVTNEYISYS